MEAEMETIVINVGLEDSDEEFNVYSNKIVSDDDEGSSTDTENEMTSDNSTDKANEAPTD